MMKGGAPLDDGASAGEQEPRALLRAGHERPVTVVENKDSHVMLLSFPLQGTP
jgi:hypothetical protein